MESRYSSPPDPVQVIQAVKYGDIEAMVYILEFYRPLIRKKIYDHATEWGLKPYETDMEDLVQIVTIRFWKKVMEFK